MAQDAPYTELEGIQITISFTRLNILVVPSRHQNSFEQVCIANMLVIDSNVCDQSLLPFVSRGKTKVFWFPVRFNQWPSFFDDAHNNNRQKAPPQKHPL